MSDNDILFKGILVQLTAEDVSRFTEALIAKSFEIDISIVQAEEERDGY